MACYNAEGEIVHVFVGELIDSTIERPAKLLARNVELTAAAASVRPSSLAKPQPIEIMLDFGPNCEHGQFGMSLNYAEALQANLGIVIAMARLRKAPK